MPSAKTVRRNREQWQPIVEAWCSSGLSASEYCQQQHLSYTAFCNWRRHFSNIETGLTSNRCPMTGVHFSQLLISPYIW